MRCRVVLVTAMALLASACPAAAEFKPTKPIEIIVQEKLSPVRLQVVNKVGGGGTTAASYVVNKKGDPHVWTVFTSVWITNPLVQQEASTKLVDMSPIARLVVEPAVIVVRADSRYQTLRDVIHAALKNPGQIKQAGGSVLARDALVRQLLMAHTGARWSFISFPAAGERLAALLGGHVDFVLVEPPEAGELIRAVELGSLVQIVDKRLAGFETVPTLPEAGFNVPNVPQARGIVGPPGMPADAVAYYEELLRKTSRSPGWQKFLHDNQLDDAFLNSKDTIAFLGEFEQQLRDILIQSGVKLVR